MELKKYQIETLDILRRFLEETRLVGPKRAYESLTNEKEQIHRIGAFLDTYRPLTNLHDVPYICLRLPTGGGKTILAAHAVSVARDAWLEKDWPTILWLVPTNTIRRQTTEALKDPRHPYRNVLDRAFDGQVSVFDITEFTAIRPYDVLAKCCIVVGTIQTLRVKSTEGRKVYAHNEDMAQHFNQTAINTNGLELFPNGTLKYSFANLLHQQQPLMIVDEAHNAVTGLTREMQSRVNPSAIIEFTATPRFNSNILHSVSASELKEEEMIKLPVILAEHDTWQEAVNGAVAARAVLANAALKDRRGIRPIVLFQAQKRNDEVPVAELKRYLIDTEHIKDDQIAIATGNQRDLDGINLFDPDCPIEYVITVEALKEGWDCSFAYIFCSISRIKSAVDVEQLLGRVLRMPYARRSEVNVLNRAYAYLSDPSFGEAARALVDKLVAMGFDEQEAQESIAQKKISNDELSFENAGERRIFSHIITVAPELAAKLSRFDGVCVVDKDAGKTEIVIDGYLDAQLESIIASSLPKFERERFSEAVSAHRAVFESMLAPAELGETFAVPRLMSSVEDMLEFSDTDVFMEHHDWTLLDHPSTLEEAEFNLRTSVRSFEIDLDGNRISYQFAREEENLQFDISVQGWTSHNLIVWLDHQLRQPDIPQSDMTAWLKRLVTYLVEEREMHISALTRCKFILSRKLRDKIEGIRHQERVTVYDRYLFSPTARTEVSFENVTSFSADSYFGQPRYRGHWKPTRHFLGPNRLPALDGEENGEEARCAQVIDSLPGIKFWIRNVSKHPASFWLPTAGGKFYPDFIALLNDGRLLVVEYKGSHLAEGSDNVEKRLIGELWERKSHGTCMFLIAERSVKGLDTREQILDKIS